MSVSRERVHARLLLDIREHGLTYGGFVRRNFMLYMVLVGLSLALLAGAMSWHQWEPFCMLAGVTLGCALRDLGWLRKGRPEWPFNERVLDWDKAKRLAAGETVAQRSSPCHREQEPGYVHTIGVVTPTAAHSRSMKAEAAPCTMVTPHIDLYTPDDASPRLIATPARTRSRGRWRRQAVRRVVECSRILNLLLADRIGKAGVQDWPRRAHRPRTADRPDLRFRRSCRTECSRGPATHGTRRAVFRCRCLDLRRQLDLHRSCCDVLSN